MLTTRETQIATKLLVAGHAITTKNLSESFGVSTRTIKYDLKKVRGFLAENDIMLHSQTGKGVWLEVTELQRERVLGALSQMRKLFVPYCQEARPSQILFSLFAAKNVVTASQLACEMDVSRNTVLSDLDELEPMLFDNGITLLREKRVGYQLKGPEEIIRAFYEQLIQKSVSAFDVYNITGRIRLELAKEDAYVRLPECFDRYYPFVEAGLQAIYAKPEMHAGESDPIIQLFFRLLISLVRVEAGHAITDEEKLYDGKKQHDVANTYLLEIFESCGLPAFEDEFLYIRGRFHDKDLPVDITGLVSDLVNEVTQLEDFPYTDDATLFSRLLSHLTVSLSDPSSNHFENPFNEGIKKNHLSLFRAVRKICRGHMGDSALSNSDSFISYLILHFLETKSRMMEGKKCNALFVCATGRGAAKLINTMLESQIEDIKVLKHCSLAEMEEAVSRLKPDIIISIFPVKSALPVVVVEPIPTRENVESIRTLVREKLDAEVLLTGKEDKNVLDFRLPPRNAEEISQGIILTGLNIYSALMEHKGHLIEESFRFAFQAHCLLLAHRHHFGKQYTKICCEYEETALKEIEAILATLGLNVENAEIIAMMNYLNRKK